MPAKLAGSKPVSFLRLFHRMGGWIAYITLAICVMVTLGSAMALSLARQFDEEGREAAGTVTFKEIVIGTDSDGDETRDYYLTIDFTTRAGEDVTVVPSVGTARYNATDVGDRLPLWYLESRPERIELDRGQNRSASGVMQIIALVFGAATMLAAWFPARKAVAAIRARRFGALEQAEVTGLHRTNITVNKRRLYRLTWREQGGRAGQSLAYRNTVLAGFHPGMKIDVYQGLKRAWWSEDVGHRPDA